MKKFMPAHRVPTGEQINFTNGFHEHDPSEKQQLAEQESMKERQQVYDEAFKEQMMQYKKSGHLPGISSFYHVSRKGKLHPES